MVPVAKGGKSTLANGVAACWSANSEKSDSVDGRLPMFLGGEPTPAYLEVYSVLSPQLRQQFERFSRLHYSDWFFNRALFRLLLGIHYLAEKACTRARDDLYYSRAAFRIRLVWKKIVSNENVPSLEMRGLAPAAPTVDQRIMLTIREETSVEGIRSMMRDLVPSYYAQLRTRRHASPPPSHTRPLAARLYYAKLPSRRGSSPSRR
jgi:hypothetical protein